MQSATDLHQHIKTLQQLKKAFENALKATSQGSIDVSPIESYVERYISFLSQIKVIYSSELSSIDVYKPEKVGYSRDLYLESSINRLLSDIDIALDTLSNDISRNRMHSGFGNAIFITHGRDEQWRRLQSYLDKQLSLETLELSQQAYRGRNTLAKLDEESNACCYAIVVMTGDDAGTSNDSSRRARPNVLHEIGFFQAKFGIDRVCLMYEIGTEIPSNIDGIGRVQFDRGKIESGFSDLHRELQEFFEV